MVAPQVLGDLLVVVEHEVGHTIFANHRVRPQLLHEEHLVGQVRGRA